MGGYIAKIERVEAPARGSRLWVDLCLDKRTGDFFANVNGKRVIAKSKDEAVKLVKEALAVVTVVQWRPVLLLRVDARRCDDDDDCQGRENDNIVFSASCSFTFLRRERANNPLKPKEIIEREHREDFELRVQKRRKHEAIFGRSTADKSRRADEAEADLRRDRDAMARVHGVWNHFEHTEEYELPYSPEAWAGIRRIAQTLRDTQAKLDEFARLATPERLLALASGDVKWLLLPGEQGPDLLKRALGSPDAPVDAQAVRGDENPGSS